MKRYRLLILGTLALVALPVGAWTIFPRLNSRLSAVEVERPGGKLYRTEDPQLLGEIETWHRSIEGPGLRQRLLRRAGMWAENGLRQPDYEVTLVFNDGHREEVAVWVYARDYVPVYTARWSGSSGGLGCSCLARSEPFTALTQAMRSSER
jgi:hypothetical protein